MLRFAKVKLTSLATGARALLGQLRGLGPEADDAASEPYDDAELLQPMGLIARPARSDTLQALVFEIAEELLGLLVRDKGQPAITDLEEGETRLYAANNGACRIRLKANGDVVIEMAAGHNVYVGGTSGAVPIALGDTVASHLAALRSYLDSHSHLAGTLAAPAGGGPVTGATGAVVLTSPAVISTCRPTTRS
jgi:phage gp45-like